MKVTQILILVISLTLLSCSKSPTTSAAESPTPSPANPVATRKNTPDFKPMSAQELLDEYVRNAAAFEQKYKGKTLNICGDILAIHTDYVSLRGGHGDNDIPIKFQVDPRDSALLANLQRGGRICLMGLYDGGAFDEYHLELRHSIQW